MVLQVPSQKLGFAENFMLSGSAAIISKTCAAPLERMKLLIQNQAERVKQGRLEVPYKGFRDCLTRIYSSEGILSFWRGNLTNIIRYIPTISLNFFLKNKINSVLQVPKHGSFQKKLFYNVISGGSAGTASLCLLFSLDYARTRLANDTKNKNGVRQFSGLIDVFRKTIQTDGFRGLYRGFGIAAFGAFVYRGLYFGLYDTAKPILFKHKSSVYKSFFLGWAVVATSSLCVYPLDTIKRRMMLTSGEKIKYRNAIHCGSTILREEGLRALYRGVGVNMLRGVAGAGVLAGFDQFKSIYLKMRE